MPNCEYCDKPLVAIGTARGNGKRCHSDWDTRKYHKKCMKYVNFKTAWSLVNKAENQFSAPFYLTGEECGDIMSPLDYDKKMRTYEWVLNHTTFKDTPPTFDEWLLTDKLFIN